PSTSSPASPETDADSATRPSKGRESAAPVVGAATLALATPIRLERCMSSTPDISLQGGFPSFAGATGWLNSEPLGPDELRGHVVLVDFWTLTCINWLRTEPYVRAWSQAYRNDGLVVIGVHTPEFSFEHQIDLVRQATTERGI